MNKQKYRVYQCPKRGCHRFQYTYSKQKLCCKRCNTTSTLQGAKRNLRIWYGSDLPMLASIIARALEAARGVDNRTISKKELEVLIELGKKKAKDWLPK